MVCAMASQRSCEPTGSLGNVKRRSPRFFRIVVSTALRSADVRSAVLSCWSHASNPVAPILTADRTYSPALSWHTIRSCKVHAETARLGSSLRVRTVWGGKLESEPSVHDNVIHGYTVDCAKGRVVLHTVFRDREPNEFTDVEFSGVVAHHFEYVLPGNILFEVEEIELSALVLDNASLFEHSWRYGWPSVEYRGDLDVLVQALRGATIRAYSVDSSYGLSGWVLAANCKRVARNGKKRMEDS
jgi:hypothetical protein